MLLGLAVAPFPASPAAADCAGPQLTIDGEQAHDPATAISLRRGDQVTVDGRYFVQGCDDTGTSGGLGCSPDNEAVPMHDIELRLVPGSGTAVSLGMEDANEAGGTSWTFTVPDDAPLGAAQLEAVDYSEPFHVTVVG